MAADFPAHKSGPSVSGVETLACLGIFVLSIAWIVAIAFLIHGAATKDTWEVVYGGVMLVILLIIRKILS